MKILTLAGVAFFGLWFWQRPLDEHASSTVWPAAMPSFGEGRADAAFALKNGTVFAAFTTRVSAADVLAVARTRYAEDGWTEIPLGMSDTALFVRDESVAAVLAETTDAGTRVTAIQRATGL